MKRPITGFHRDEEAHWVAELECGHLQHTRHAPPFTERPWVESAGGREQRIGMALECVRCDRRELPAGHVAIGAPREFSESTIPAALGRRHRTKPGVWARLVVRSGRLRVRMQEPFQEEHCLAADGTAVVPPGVAHDVVPLGAVRFVLELWGPPPTGAPREG